MKKKCKVLFTSLLLLLGLTACEFETSKSFSFAMENGDIIEVDLKDSGGYDLTKDDHRFYVNKDDKMILRGTFLSRESYDSLIVKSTTAENASKVEDVRKEKGYYYFEYFNEDNEPYQNLLVEVEGLSSCVILESAKSKEEVLDAYQYLTLLKEE